MEKNNYEKDTLGAIGIGAMIVFIALVLVAAVASAVIIQTGEKLQQNAQQTGSDTQREISGKITINNMVVNTPTEYLLYFESSPGSDVLNVDDIEWQMTCEDAVPAFQYISDNFDNDGGMTTGGANTAGYRAAAADDATRAAVTTIDAGSAYVLVIDADGGTASTDCSPVSLGVNGEATLWIHVNGGGSTYETLYISDTSEGSLVI